MKILLVSILVAVACVSTPLCWAQTPHRAAVKIEPFLGRIERIVPGYSIVIVSPEDVLFCRASGVLRDGDFKKHCVHSGRQGPIGSGKTCQSSYGRIQVLEHRILDLDGYPRNLDLKVLENMA